MKKIIDSLENIIAEYPQKFAHLSQTAVHEKLHVAKWSKKEVIGHLIDSAHNNLRRFIVGQYDPSCNITYDQNFWVDANNYQNTGFEDILHLWEMMNKRICAVLEQMPAENYTLEINTGSGTVQMHSLEWLAADYVKHLQHHINQVLPGSFDVVYP